MINDHPLVIAAQLARNKAIGLSWLLNLSWEILEIKGGFVKTGFILYGLTVL